MATKSAKQKAEQAEQSEQAVVTYKTTEKKSASFDIQIQGVVLNGEWDNAREYVSFKVPVELTEAFETHWHFKAGNIVKV